MSSSPSLPLKAVFIDMRIISFLRRDMSVELYHSRYPSDSWDPFRPRELFFRSLRPKSTRLFLQRTSVNDRGGWNIAMFPQEHYLKAVTTTPRRSFCDLRSLAGESVATANQFV